MMLVLGRCRHSTLITHAIPSSAFHRSGSSAPVFPFIRSRRDWRGGRLVSPGGQFGPHTLLQVGRRGLRRRRQPDRGYEEPDELRHGVPRPRLCVREERGRSAEPEDAQRQRLHEPDG